MSSSKTKNRINRRKQLDMNVNNPELAMAKASLDTCLWACLSKAIVSGTNKGRVVLEIQFQIDEVIDEKMGYALMRPKLGHETIYQVLGLEEEEEKKEEESNA